MIRIINGVYGRVVDGLVKPVYPGDPPISLSAEREAELVESGNAEYVKKAPAAAEPVEEEAEPQGAEYPEDLLYQMKKKELVDYAESMGLEVDPRETKEDLIARIHAAEGEETPPAFSAEEAIQ